MNSAPFLLALKEEIARLQRLQVLVEDESGPAAFAGSGKRRGRPPGITAVKQAPAKQVRSMSEAGRASIAAAQKRRWAAKKKAEAAAAQTTGAKKAAAPVKTSAVPVKKAVSKTVTVPAGALKKTNVPAKKLAVKSSAAPLKVSVEAKKARPAVKKAKKPVMPKKDSGQTRANAAGPKRVVAGTGATGTQQAVPAEPHISPSAGETNSAE